MNANMAIHWPTTTFMPFSGNPAATFEHLNLHAPLLTTSYTDWIDPIYAELPKLYQEIDPDVLAFLQDHVSLPEIVYMAAKVLRQEFGEDVRLKLEVTRHPDSGEKELFALVQMPANVSPEEALMKLHRFDENWFLDIQEIVNGLFNVDVVFG